jgi:uncharacterized protein YjbI with pentapeptide repeats
MAAILLVLIYVFVVSLPRHAVEVATMAKDSGLKRLELQNEIARTNAQIIGGSVILLGLYFTWRQVRATEAGHITDRYTAAVDQLGNKEQLAVRMAGLIALERIGSGSFEERWMATEVIAAYLRQRRRETSEVEFRPLPGQKKPRGTKASVDIREELGWIPSAPADVQAALASLSRLRRRKEERPIDLTGSDLRTVWSENAKLAGAILSLTHFENATLLQADLSEADLGGAYFNHATLCFASLRRAFVDDASFEFADLRKADLRELRLYKDRQLERLWAQDQDQAVMASIPTVRFRDADLREANLKGADLTRADLRGADLSTAVGLMQSQVEAAQGDAQTKLPTYLHRPDSWARADLS